MNFLQKFREFISQPTHSRTMGFLIILVLVFAVFLTVTVSQQQQTIKQHAANYNCGGSAWINPDLDCFSAANDCNWGLCRGTSGGQDSCQSVPKDNDTPCQASDWTTGKCNNGTCESAVSWECGQAANPDLNCWKAPYATDCTIGKCNTSSHTCYAEPKDNGSVCTASDWTTGKCNNGTCESAVSWECGQAADPDWNCWKAPYATDCSTGKCNTSSHTCYAEPKNEGGSCNNGAGTCSGGVCGSGGGTTGTCTSNGMDCTDKNDRRWTSRCDGNSLTDYYCDSNNECAKSVTQCPNGSTCEYSSDPAHPEYNNLAYCEESCTKNGGHCKTSCLSSESVNSTYSCVNSPAGSTCCMSSSQPPTTYTCTNTYGQSCMSSCSSGYTQGSGTCASGVCCKASTTTYTCTNTYGQSCMSSCSSGYTQGSGTCASGVCCKASTQTPISPVYPPVNYISPTVTSTPTPANIILVSALNIQDAPIPDSFTAELTLYSLTTNNVVTGAPATQIFNKTSIPDRQYSVNITLTNLAQGKYFIIIRKDNMIAKAVFTVSGSGTTVTVPTTTLVFGDVNTDNKIDAIDYNLFKACWKQPASSSCSPNDFDQNGGNINEVDFNTLMRGWATWTKEGQGL